MCWYNFESEGVKTSFPNKNLLRTYYAVGSVWVLEI